MSDAIIFRKKFIIKGGDFLKAGEASVEVKNILKEVGYESEIVRRAAITSYEAEMNVIMYGRGGEMDLLLRSDEVFIVVHDDGPGISNIQLAMQEGYSTATQEMREMGFGAGMGLPNIKKNADDFQIISDVNQGTRLEILIKCTGMRHYNEENSSFDTD
jgi:anti-sigma regulatory factor (Ser/Thr protein kinase)